MQYNFVPFALHRLYKDICNSFWCKKKVNFRCSVNGRLYYIIFLKNNMLIGYARVSKSDGSQNIDLQKDALIKAGVNPKNIYEEYASGKREARPILNSCLKALRDKEDTLIVWKLDRLGRNLGSLIFFVKVMPFVNLNY